MTANSNASNILLFIILVPLALVFGWVIASPLDYTGAAVFGLILATLLSPVLIKHHHPIAVFCWNAFLSAMFLPGDLPLWVLMAFVAVGFGILHRIIDRKVVWVTIPSMNWTLAILAAVVLLTAKATGGIGLRAAGGSSYGGKNYLLVLGAIMGYFALSSSRIPIEKAGRYTALFFLPALTAVVGHIAFALGPAAYWLFYFFPSDLVMNQAAAESGATEIVRLNGVTLASINVIFYLLARYGVAGIFDLTRPLRLVLFGALLLASLLGGFRSLLMLAGMVFFMKLILEGLWRTRFMAGLVLLGAVGAAVILPNSDRLPLSMQRTLSFLPVEVDRQIRIDAEDSTLWRLDMWKLVTPTLPGYLYRGRGYHMDPATLYFTDVAIRRGWLPAYEGSIVSLSFHNGFLTNYVPFGGPGFLAFVAFLAAGLRVVYRNYRHGDVRLKNMNGLLFALFTMRIVFYFAVFGSFNVDLCYFTGIVGFSVALNGGVAGPARAPAPQRSMWRRIQSAASPLTSGPSPERA